MDGGIAAVFENVWEVEECAMKAAFTYCQKKKFLMTKNKPSNVIPWSLPP